MKHTKKAVKHLLPLGAALMAGGLSMQAMAEGVDEKKAEETTLSTVKVEANVEVEDGYRATKTRVGRTLQDPHDIPQAITTVTRALMEEQQVGSLREALRNVSGLTFNAAEGGRAGDNMMLRGFYTFGDMYLDGIRDTAQYNREIFNLEQVDVLRGAAATMFGRGQAGGVINMVSKAPKLKDEYKITGSIGTDGYYEGTGDFNKKIGEHSAIRINAMHRDEGSWRANPANGDEPEIHRDGLAISLGFGINTDDEFNLSHVHTITDDKPDYGISFNATTRSPQTTYPAKTYWGTDRNFDNSVTAVTTGTYTHKFSPDSELRTQVRHGQYDRSYWARTPSLTVAPNAGGTICTPNCNGGPTRVMNYETYAVQSVYNNKLNLLGMKHEFLAGVEYLHEDLFRNALRNLGGTTGANPPRYAPYEAATTGAVRFDADSYAIYGQDTVEFIPQWKATLGLRYDQLEANFSSNTSPKLSYGELSTRASLAYHQTDEINYYVSYSDSFSPTADLYQLTVTPLPPECSQVVELGTKWLFLDGDLALRAALYHANKDWERNTDVESTAAILTKQRKTDGFELEAAGRITPNWEVFSGLALMDSKVLQVAENVNATTGVVTTGNAGYVGQRSRNTPVYTFNLWTTYKIPNIFGGTLKVGGGIEAKGDRYGYNPSGAGAIPTLAGSSAFHPNTAPAYERYDAMVSYERKNWTLRLNVQNLLDTTYYDALYDNGGFTTPGTRRKGQLTAEYKF
ncbi:MAG: TonB-dependent siderophore receptor [Methylophilaceae bacterium]